MLARRCERRRLDHCARLREGNDPSSHLRLDTHSGWWLDSNPVHHGWHYSYVSAGSPAPLTIYLSRAANSGAAGAQVDLLFDDLVFGAPTCTKPNETRLNAHTLDVQFNPQLLDREPPTPAGKKRLRLLIVDRDNGTPITTGAIAQCSFPTINRPEYANQFERFTIDTTHDFVTDANGGLRLADPAKPGAIEILFPAGAPAPTPNTTHCQKDGQEGRC